MADRNPFHYGSPVTGDEFAGRGQELKDIVSLMQNSINVALISPRRYGKTSLLEEAVITLERATSKPAVIYVNALECVDFAALASKMVTEAYRMPGMHWRRMKQSAEEFMKRFRVQPTFAVDNFNRLTFSLQPSLAAEDGVQVVEDIYQLLNDAATSRPAVLIIDEFQDVLRFNDRLPYLLKAFSDQYPDVCLTVAGSQQHLMSQLVISEHAPLYGMTERIGLQPIPTDEMIPYLVERAAMGKKRLTSGTARLIVDLAGPVPNDIQRLAHQAYELAGRTIDEGAVESAVQVVVDHESHLFEERLQRLTAGQERVLRALAGGSEASIGSSRFARGAGMATATSVRGAIEALEKAELITRRNRQWVLVDPFFAEWLESISRDGLSG
jgi:hypothetical protein